MQKNVFLLAVLVFGLPFSVRVFAQGYFKDHKLPFYAVNGQRLRNALAGGMAAPQFSQADLNGDSLPELVVFEREDSTFSVYRNFGSKSADTWRYDPALSALFDGCACRAWALLRDFNGDGLEDVFCSTTEGTIRVYRQQRINGVPVFGLYIPLLQGDYRIGQPLSVYVPNSDLPAIADVDHDGDLDLLTFSGTDNTLEYHRNVGDSLFPGTADTMFMYLATTCWGNFSESDTGNAILLQDPATECQIVARPAGTNHVAGSAILALDLDNDQDMDLILGDEGTKHVLTLINHGTPVAANMGQVIFPYPANSAIEINNYVAVYQIDADNDRLNDLVSAPLKYKSVENYKAVTFHKNRNTNENPDFIFAQKGFLQNTTIDVGDMAAPVFVHLNGDTLPDLLVGNRGYFSPTDSIYTGGRLMAFLNTGTAANPAFTLIDSNFLDLPGVSPTFMEACPTVGDLDADGDPDLVVGGIIGTLLLYRNTGFQHGIATFSPEPTAFSGIDVGNNAAPLLYDLDHDGDLDLLIGNLLGRLRYYQNTGTAAQPVWTLNTETFGHVRVSPTSHALSAGYARPQILDYDGDGTDDLLIGEVDGGVVRYVLGDPADTLVRLGKLPGIDAGKNGSPAFAKLDSTGDWSILLGNQRGGLQLWRSLQLPEVDTLVSLPQPLAPDWQLIPNPASGAVLVHFAQARPREIAVWSATGQLMLRQPCTDADCRVELAAWPQGVYMVVVDGGPQGISTRRLVVE